VVALAGGLRSQGHDVVVGTVLEPGAIDPLRGPLDAAGVRAERLEVPPRRYRMERRLVRELLESCRPMLFHSHGYRPDVVDRGVARRLRIPTLSTVHGFTGGGPRNRLYERLQVRSLRRFDRVVAVSRPLMQFLETRGVRRERLRCIPNGWSDGTFLSRNEARRVLGLGETGFVIGWIGRLSAEKGPDVFLRALAAMGAPDVLACILGDGPDAERTRALAAELGLEARVRWCGVVPDAARVAPAFDVIALTSRTEGTPMVLLEGIAAGVPVVATRVGGVPDVVSEEEVTLVPSEDSEAVASALSALLADPFTAQARALAARVRLARERDTASWVRQYEAVYRELVPT